jgi:hypothetical protein
MKRIQLVATFSLAAALAGCIHVPHGPRLPGPPILLPPIVPASVPVPRPPKVHLSAPPLEVPPIAPVPHPPKVHLSAPPLPVPPLPPIVVPPHPSVLIPLGHVHGPSCGHYFHGGAWYFHNGHIHGKKCGHKWKGGKWILP